MAAPAPTATGTARGPHLRFLLRRLRAGVPVVLLIVTFNFFMLHLAPGDPASVLAGESGAASPEYIAQLRAQFGLDRSLPVQYFSYLSHILRFDLGYSFRYGASNLSLILDRLAATLLLMVSSTVLAVSVGAALGVYVAARRQSVAARVMLVLAVLAYAAPVYWLGLMLIVAFSIELRLLPTSGMWTVGAEYQGLRYGLDVAQHLLLPALTLSFFYMALYMRLMRTSVLDTLGRDFITTARAKGVRPGRILRRHVLRNAIVPVLTMAGVQVSGMLGGAVVVESVFGWPGLGQLAFEALRSRDLNLLLGILILSSLLVIIVNTVVDLLHARIDPRIELG